MNLGQVARLMEAAEAEENSAVFREDLKALFASLTARGQLLREVLVEKFDEAALADWCERAKAELE